MGHTESDVWYRIHLTVRDSGGLTTTVFRDVQPRTVQLTLATSPAGLSLRLDGQPRTTPLTVTGVVGVQRTLEAPSPQTVGGRTYEFVQLVRRRREQPHDHHARRRTRPTRRRSAKCRPPTGGLTATYYDNVDFTGATVTRVDGTVDFVWGSGAPATGIAADTFSTRWVGTRAAADERDVHLLHGERRRRPPLGERPAGREQLDRPRADGELRHDQPHRRREVRDPDGVLRARRRRGGAAALERTLAGEGRHPPVSTPASLRGADQLPAGRRARARRVPGRHGRPVSDSRAAGERLGWNADNTAQTRDRNAANSPDQRFDTLTHLQKPANPNAFWEIALPNGTYTVRVVAGDPSNIDSVFRLNVEGALFLSGTPTSATRWVDVTASVTVSDGRLTISNGSGASNNKLCFVEIS